MNTENLKVLATQAVNMANAKWNGSFELADLELRCIFGSDGMIEWLAKIGRVERTASDPDTALVWLASAIEAKVGRRR